uniref:Uncharacterized protein n=1 Tax=Arundo donax TaxID=35708 RepID=A0A0A9C8K5_ARUDO
MAGRRPTTAAAA